MAHLAIWQLIKPGCHTKDHSAQEGANDVLNIVDQHIEVWVALSLREGQAYPSIVKILVRESPRDKLGTYPPKLKAKLTRAEPSVNLENGRRQQITCESYTKFKSKSESRNMSVCEIANSSCLQRLHGMDWAWKSLFRHDTWSRCCRANIAIESSPSWTRRCLDSVGLSFSDDHTFIESLHVSLWDCTMSGKVSRVAAQDYR